MNIYRPTWLYIKKHNQTGLKYFGKTTSRDPYKYLGSGIYWRKHLAKHGTDISTLWCHLYDNREELIDDALTFSRLHGIMNSDEWANLILENGINGGSPKGSNLGITRSQETREKMSKAAVVREENKKLRGHKDSEETRARKSAASKRKYSLEVRERNSAGQRRYFETHPGHLLGKKQPTISCPHCGKVGGAGPMRRFHFDHCKLKP